MYFAARDKAPKTRKDVYEKLGLIFPKNQVVPQRLFLKHMKDERFVPGQLVSSLDPHFAGKCEAIREYGKKH